MTEIQGNKIKGRERRMKSINSFEEGEGNDEMNLSKDKTERKKHYNFHFSKRFCSRFDFSAAALTYQLIMLRLYCKFAYTSDMIFSKLFLLH